LSLRFGDSTVGGRQIANDVPNAIAGNHGHRPDTRTKRVSALSKLLSALTLPGRTERPGWFEVRATAFSGLGNRPTDLAFEERASRWGL
jgi:hypothetical protein